jgi:hypothetical protein
LDLVEDIQNVGAELYWYPVGFVDAATLEINKQYAIFIDQSKFSTTRSMKGAIAHELGHCATGCTHKVCSPIDLVEKHEYIANRWAIERYLPFDVMKDAMEHGYVETWSLADYFDLPEDFVIKAIQYYTVHQGRKFG